MYALPPLCLPGQSRSLTTQVQYEEFARYQDEPGILRSRDYFTSLIKDEINKGIKPSRIVLGGFSQGGAMSVFTGLTGSQKLGGVFGLSCYLLLSDRIRNYIPKDWPNKDTPFFLAHGEEDDVVLFEFGKKTAEALREMGVNVSFHSYPYVPVSPSSRPLSRILTDASSGLPHSADPAEIEDLERFLEKILPPEGNGQAAAGL